MRYMKSFAVLSITTLMALGWVACGAAGAQLPQESSEAGDAGNEPSLLERVFEPDPEPVVVPAGTLLALRLEDTLSSHESPAGASFSAMVTQEVSVDGDVVVPSGSIVRGHVVEARPAKKIGGRAILEISFDELETKDGEIVGISAHLTEVGKSEVVRDAAIIGGSTIGGAIIGEAIHEGEGGTVGAIVGGIAGTVGALKTEGKPVVLPAGTSLGIALDSQINLTVR